MKRRVTSIRSIDYFSSPLTQSVWTFFDVVGDIFFDSLVAVVSSDESSRLAKILASAILVGVGIAGVWFLFKMVVWAQEVLDYIG